MSIKMTRKEKENNKKKHAEKNTKIQKNPPQILETETSSGNN